MLRLPNASKSYRSTNTLCSGPLTGNCETTHKVGQAIPQVGERPYWSGKQVSFVRYGTAAPAASGRKPASAGFYWSVAQPGTTMGAAGLRPKLMSHTPAPSVLRTILGGAREWGDSRLFATSGP